MIELFVDNQRIALSADQEMTIISRNPLLTREGDYTLDINISLNNAENAKAYKCIDRVTNTITLSKNRKVLIYKDGRVILDGTEAILSSSEEEVKIQILSGNSELNFCMKDDLMIRDLNMGLISFTAESANNLNGMNDQAFTRGNFCFPLMKVNDSGKQYLINDWTKRYIDDRTNNNGVYPSWNNPADDNLHPQLYLDFAINEIMKALSFKVVENIFSTDDVLKYIIVNTARASKKVNEILPNMTVANFINIVEETFEVKFITGPDKTVSVVSAAGTMQKYITKEYKAYDGFTKEFVDAPDNYKKITYKRGTDNQSKRLVLKEDIVTGRQYSTTTGFGYVVNLFKQKGMEAAYNESMLVKDSIDETFYYVSKEWTKYIVTKLGIFSQFGDTKEVDSSPVSSEMERLEFVIDRSGVMYRSEICTYIPILEKKAVESKQTIDDIVLNGEQKEDKDDLLQLSFYSGPQTIRCIGNSMSATPEYLIRYPFCYTDYNSIDYRSTDDKYDLRVTGQNKTLRPKLNDLSKALVTTEEYTFLLPEKPKWNEKCIIHNKVFIPVESKGDPDKKNWTVKCVAVKNY